MTADGYVPRPDDPKDDGPMLGIAIIAVFILLVLMLCRLLATT